VRAKALNSGSGGRDRGLLAIVAALWILFGFLTIGSPGELAAKPLAKPQVHMVEIHHFQFSPATVEAKPGDVITWKNLDVAPHTATSKKWDSAKLNRNQTWSLKVTDKGTFEYICTYHPAMKGKIVVK